MHMLLAKVYETQKNGPVGDKKKKKTGNSATED